MKPIFTGACTALVTPFNEDGSVDYISFGRLVEFQISGGIGALLFLGTTGESCTLTRTEKREIVDFALSTVAGRVPVIIGIGGNDPAAIIEFGKECASRPHPRPEAVLVSSPYYNKATQPGLVKYFHTIADAVKLPVIVYNVPARTGINIEPETMREISAHKNIAGIKESAGNIAQLAEIIRLCPDTAVYAGDDALALPAYALGAKGVISVASNAAPTETQKIYGLYTSGSEARTLFLNQLPLYKALFAEVNPIPVKYMLSKMGLIENNLRLPLTPLGAPNRPAVDALIKE
jgi:4-hydroxy-tetrahydrodipicolinate synthase